MADLTIVFLAGPRTRVVRRGLGARSPASRSRALVLRATTHFKYMAPRFLTGTRWEPRGVFSWVFVLEPTLSGTRLVSRRRGTGEPRRYLTVLKPLIWLVDHVQQPEILKGVKRRVERC